MNLLKKNLIYNGLLTVSQYIFPILTFPYVTRVLGADGIGTANFALSIVDYAVLFANLGLLTVGVKEISSCNDDTDKRSNVFSQLVSLHIISTIVVVIIYLLCCFLFDSFIEVQSMLLIGLSRIVLNIMVVEWLYQGMQNFKYVTVRSIIVRTIYVISIFIFVKDNSDYDIYFASTIALYVVNGMINWRYSKNYVQFRFTFSGIPIYAKSVITWGAINILLSFYTTFNVLYLGIECGNAAVGYYTTAIKLYAIFLSMFTAYNTVFIPYLNSMYAKGDEENFKKTLSTSFDIVSEVSLPIIFFCITLAPEIITIIAGNGFERSIYPFQIIIIQLLLVGLSQIMEMQILLTLGKNKEVFISTCISALLSVVIIVCCVPKFEEVASAYAVAIPHIIECILLMYFARKSLEFSFPIVKFLRNIFIYIPIIIICLLVKTLLINYILVILVSTITCIVYFVAVQLLITKNIKMLKLKK